MLLGTSYSCTDLDVQESTETATDYKLLTEHNDEASYWRKRHLINYFVMVALGSEYGPDFRISRRWHSDMKVFVKGDYELFLYEEMIKIVGEINDLAQDGFKVEIVDQEKDANFTAYIMTKEEYLQFHPEASERIKVNDGLFSLTMDDFTIVNGNLFIDAELRSQEHQKHLIREELTQSLGLGNDIEFYPNSIFYQQPSRVTEYSLNDKEIIRLLYHPNMIAGLSEQTVRSVLADILGI